MADTDKFADLEKRLASFPRVSLCGSLPTPLEAVPYLAEYLGGPRILVKRDDCTGLAFGGNKAKAEGADTLLTTGAVQSNHVRQTAAAAAQLGLRCEVQLEDRVPGRRPEYHNSGNPFLIRLFQPVLHHFYGGEDEKAADDELNRLADRLREKGRKPFVIGLALNHVPLGALGYVRAAMELVQQCIAADVQLDAIVLGSGSGSTHSGMLVGLRALGVTATVYGICVRRNAEKQRPRIIKRVKEVLSLLDLDPSLVREDEILVDDSLFHPGYGQPNKDCIEAVRVTARKSGLLLDPCYTGKAMGGLFRLARSGALDGLANVVFLHTGGTPGLFGYPEVLDRERFPEENGHSNGI